MFLHLSVNHSVHRGDVCPSACWDTHTPLCRHPPGQTSPWTDTRQADTSLDRHPPGRHPQQMATAADRTHPTEMHSCFVKDTHICIIASLLQWAQLFRLYSGEVFNNS